MKHFLLAMATLWCVAGTFSLFAADNNNGSLSSVKIWKTPTTIRKFGARLMAC
ncbi:hypothetical protein [Parabacteroides distasonis]|uniref:hypothetical protein n=1 Tax=Parabacteroides distasonis TaxID=823 RepID=UPI001FD3D608|nr:hypothetical protein [Parabacteroides distasonis]